MFYIIEQQNKNLQITKIISDYLKNRYPKIAFKILQSFKAPPTHRFCCKVLNLLSNKVE
ncbi:hypothetical protein HPA42_08365 [Streptococcus suis]|uniref:hypothetical protein n=1 Tax=Streptococcus suis TaxID=1307 RepID=UPI000768F611|nr:hypothetical protein [Streptococcus suis]NQN19762.1 hypothetical protein [Streptococcus suis]CYY24566.1 Uncharacterised protein [Streptococcus suis]